MSILQKFKSGVGWGTVSVVVVTLFQLVFVSVMARLLEPQDFGIVAVAHVCLRFFTYFAKMGIGPALIQKPKLTSDDVSAALAMSLGISTFFFFVLFSLSGLIEDFFNMKDLASVTSILALNFVVVGFSSVSISLMRRKGAFKKIAIVELVSYVLGYGIFGLGSAFIGLGIWALVIAFMSQSLLAAAISYSFERHSLRVRHNRTDRKHFLSYGGRYSIIGFIEFLSSNIDAFVIAKTLGAEPAGLYNRSLLLANLPVQQPANVLSKVLFPLLSTKNNGRRRQSYSAQFSALVVGIYGYSVSIGIFFAATDIVEVMLGPAWSESIPLLKILSWSVGPMYVSHVLGVTFDAMDQLKPKLKIQGVSLLLMLVLIVLATPSRNAENIAFAIVTTEWFRLIATGLFLIRFLNISVIEALTIVLSICFSVTVTGLLVGLSGYLIPFGVSPVVSLLAKIMAGAFGLGLGLVFAGVIGYRQPAVRLFISKVPRLQKLFHRSEI